MAKGRMLNKKISLDDAVNRLSCDTARLLYTWIISHLDQHGCFYGDANVVKNLIFPLRNDIKSRKVEQFLQEMESESLIQRYEVKKTRYIFCQNFTKNQVGLRPDREAESDIPRYNGNKPESVITPDLLRQNDGNTPPEQNRSIKEQKVMTETLRQKRREENHPPLDAPGWLLTIFEFKGFYCDLVWVKRIETDFPDIDLVESAKDFTDYWSERQKGITSVKLAWRNWLKKARELGKCLNPTETPYTGH